jgi:hypothetical protein
MTELAKFFRTSESGRDAFLSRLFGMLSEEVVRAWCAVGSNPFEDLGRPTLRGNGIKNFYTLDFTLRERATNRVYVAEMKCELQFDNYRQLTLMDGRQILRHQKLPAFAHFLALAREPDRYQVAVAGKPVDVDGSILVWGDVAPDASAMAAQEFGIYRVLSVAEIVHDLAHDRPASWHDRIATWQRWSNELFDFLAAQDHEPKP